MNKITMYRRRYVPDEKILLQDDIILHADEDVIIAKWHVLHPRKDIDHGISAYFLKEGYKISKILDAENRLVYWYCDIIETEIDAQNNVYTFHDLLIDIIVYPDNHVEVVDLDEIADVIGNGLLTREQTANALYCANNLLQIIYKGNFHKLQKLVEDYEEA